MRNIRKRIAEHQGADCSAAPEEGAVEEAAPAKKRKKRSARAKKPSVATHPIYVPLLTAWGAAVCGLSILVLPPHMIGRFSAVLGLGGLGPLAGYVLAAIAALVGAVIAFGVARVWKSRASDTSRQNKGIAKLASDRVRPIDPASELGSESLDAPIETEPFAASEPADPEFDDEQREEAPVSEDEGECEAWAEVEEEIAPEPQDEREPTLGELAERDYELEPRTEDSEAEDKPKFTRRDFEDALRATCESAAEDAHERVGEEEEAVEDDGSLAEPTQSPGPRQIDLAEFAELPGRNAVWVEEPAPEAEPEDAPEDATEAEPEPEPEPQDQVEPQPDPSRTVEEVGAEEVADVTPAVPAAVAKLRSVPPKDLSLVQMVERFAVALHDHQEAERANPTSQPSPQRDAALAEALKALTMFTESGIDADLAALGADKASAGLKDTTDELREALAKLQKLRGAA